MTPDERRVVYAEGITDAQRWVLVAHLDQPHLSTAELARLLRRGRSTVHRALTEGHRLGLLGPLGPQRVAADCAASGTTVPAAAQSVPLAAQPVCQQRHSAAFVAPSEVTTSVVPTEAQLPEQLGLLGPQPVAEPKAKPKPKRKGQPQSHGTGLSTPGLRAFVDDVYRAREAAGLDQRLADRIRDTAAVAAALRRGLTMAEVLAYAPNVPTLSVGAFQLEANRRATAPRGGARHAARADAASLASSQALADAWDKDAALAELNALPD